MLPTTEEQSTSIDLVKADFYEALACHQIINSIDLDAANEKSAALSTTMEFILKSLLFRMAMAIDRLTQFQNSNRVSLVILLKENRNIFSETAIDEITNDPFLEKLRACRHGFMAHTLTGSRGSRQGFTREELGDFFFSKIIPATTKLFNALNVSWGGWESYQTQWIDISSSLSDLLASENEQF